ncbi:MAG: alpha-amylase family glycosyl hydrolase [Bacteroidia bacterium]|nr:alpha-amylase family glycosyl hydrolase [Bacteroidia bacterium]
MMKRNNLIIQIMEKLPVGLLALLLAIVLTIAGCSIFGGKKEVKPFVSEVVHPEWSKNSVLYEVNVRQYTDEGTFNAFAKHLSRLKALGVDVLWFMPTYPIGIVNKKGELGSYYSIKDYMDINPAFGTLDDFKAVIKKAHELGMHVILDWVPNHTSWDNKLAVEHPDWYIRDSTGKFTPPIGFDWTDVIQLDWSKQGLQNYMLEAMKFWVNLGADGFRVDYPPNTPKEFWERVRTELTAIKPVLLLAESEDTKFLEKGFDMNYAWEMHHLMNRVAQGKDSVNFLVKYYNKEWSVYPNNVYRLQFLTNHDENTWAGTIDSLMGASQQAFATLIFTGQGVPLIYSGQEVCLDKRLKFFVRDTIKWDTCSLTGFYKNLISLKKYNKALWNGDFGGPMIKIRTNKDNKVFAFYREKDESRVIVILNLSKKGVAVKPVLENLNGDYSDYFTNAKTAIPFTDSLRLEPWGYKVLVK